MPIGPINTPKQKRAVVKTEMSKFKSGDLHSGSKTGPVVKNPRQAVAIALSESDQSKPHVKQNTQARAARNPGDYDNSAHKGLVEGGYLRKGEEFRPGAEEVAKEATARMEENLAENLGMQPASEYRFQHQSLQRAHTFGHSVGNRDGSLRLSGNPRAHQIGKRK